MIRPSRWPLLGFCLPRAYPGERQPFREKTRTPCQRVQWGATGESASALRLRRGNGTIVSIVFRQTDDTPGGRPVARLGGLWCLLHPETPHFLQKRPKTSGFGGQIRKCAESHIRTTGRLPVGPRKVPLAGHEPAGIMLVRRFDVTLCSVSTVLFSGPILNKSDRPQG